MSDRKDNDYYDYNNKKQEVKLTGINVLDRLSPEERAAVIKWYREDWLSITPQQRAERLDMYYAMKIQASLFPEIR